jgi:hypothetical protein
LSSARSTGAAAGPHRFPSAWVYLLGAAVVGTALIFLRVRWALPLGQALLAWPVLWRDLREGRLLRGCAHMLFWAAATSVFTILLTVQYPQACEAAILKGASYREEMFSWIRTGIGAEGTPARFIPQHILHYLLTLGLSFVTAGLAGLALGAVLLNYMNFYVGSLILVSVHPARAAIFGWPVWPVLRVIAFVLGAIAAAHLLLGPVLHRGRWNRREWRLLMLWSAALFVADIALKAALAPGWRQILLGAMGR